MFEFWFWFGNACTIGAICGLVYLGVTGSPPGDELRRWTRKGDDQ